MRCTAEITSNIPATGHSATRESASTLKAPIAKGIKGLILVRRIQSFKFVICVLSGSRSPQQSHLVAVPLAPITIMPATGYVSI